MVVVRGRVEHRRRKRTHDLQLHARVAHRDRFEALRARGNQVGEGDGETCDERTRTSEPPRSRPRCTHKVHADGGDEALDELVVSVPQQQIALAHPCSGIGPSRRDEGRGGGGRRIKSHATRACRWAQPRAVTQQPPLVAHAVGTGQASASRAAARCVRLSALRCVTQHASQPQQDRQRSTAVARRSAATQVACLFGGSAHRFNGGTCGTTRPHSTALTAVTNDDQLEQVIIVALAARHRLSPEQRAISFRRPQTASETRCRERSQTIHCNTVVRIARVALRAKITPRTES